MNGHPDLEAGDRVKVVTLIKDEPCSDFDVLLGHTGLVTNPGELDTDYEGNPITLVSVTFDEPAIEPVSGEPCRHFVFRPEELEKIN